MRPITNSRSFRPAFTLSLCVVFHGLSRGQVLAPADVLAPDGVPFSSLVITDFIPWDTLEGSGVLWDYGWITVDSTTGISYTSIPVSEAPDAGDYPDADRVERSVSGPQQDYIIDRFFSVDGDRLSEIGSVGPVLSYVYEAPGLVYGLGMDLGDTLDGAYCYWSDGFDIQYHFCGEDHVAFDAVGTLVLPYGTFYDVKHVTQWASSFETTEPATDSSYHVRQRWSVPGVPFPVLDASVFIDSQGNWYPAARLLDQASVTTVAEARPQPLWHAWPNPTTGNVQLSDLPAGTKSIDVLSEDGRILMRTEQAAPGATAPIPLAALSDGVYVIRVTQEQAVTTRRVVKAAR